MSPSALVSALVCLPLVLALPSIKARQDLVPALIPFNATQQYISTTGAHAFVPPGPGDLRSPCPGLNALANHNYIPHNGNVTLLQIVPVLAQVYGMGQDLGTVLAMIGVLSTGDHKSLSFSIAGWSDILKGFDHNQFKGLYDLGMLEGADAIEQICSKYASTNAGQYATSSDPIAGAYLGPLVDTLIFRCMANKTAAFPGGTLDHGIELSLLSEAPNGDDTFSKNFYHERLPDDWYTRNQLDLWDVPFLASDYVRIAAAGGFSNKGPSNSTDMFAGIDMSALTLGSYSNEQLLVPAARTCFLAQAVGIVVPAMASNPIFDAATRKVAKAAASDFVSGTQKLPCDGYSLKGMDLTLLGKLLNINLLGL